jgi:hypothetical protein
MAWHAALQYFSVVVQEHTGWAHFSAFELMLFLLVVDQFSDCN